MSDITLCLILHHEIINYWLLVHRLAFLISLLSSCVHIQLLSAHWRHILPCVDMRTDVHAVLCFSDCTFLPGPRRGWLNPKIRAFPSTDSLIDLHTFPPTSSTGWSKSSTRKVKHQIALFGFTCGKLSNVSREIEPKYFTELNIEASASRLIHRFSRDMHYCPVSEEDQREWTYFHLQL